MRSKSTFASLGGKASPPQKINQAHFVAQPATLVITSSSVSGTPSRSPPHNQNAKLLLRAAITDVGDPTDIGGVGVMLPMLEMS